MTRDYMPLRPANLVHTDEGALEESTAYGVGTGSPEPGTRSSAGERCLHTADVVGSIPTASTTSTTRIGDISEALAIAEFMRLGYLVSRPFSNGLPYDFIADDGAQLYRVQVKTGAVKRGALHASLGSSKYHRGRRERVGYVGRVELVCIVNQATGRCYVVKPEAAAGSVVLRLEPSGNNQAAGVRWAHDYELKAPIQ
jgi:hypothetical protein